MNFFFGLAVLVAAAISVAKPLEKGQLTGGLTICNGPSSTGNCSYQVYELDTCHDMPREFSRNAATFAPDRAGFYCLPYLTACGGVCHSPTGCTSGPISYDTLDKNNLAAIGGGWDRLIASFKCHAGKAPI